MEKIKNFIENNLAVEKIKLTGRKISFLGSSVNRVDFPNSYSDLEKFEIVCPGLVDVIIGEKISLSKELRGLFEQYFKHIENDGVPVNSLKDSYGVEEDNLAVLINYTNPDDIRLYDVIENEILGVDYRTFIKSFPDWRKVTPSIVKFIYNPYSTDSSLGKLELKKESILTVSTYIPPVWRDTRNEVEPKIPPQIKKFLLHLFPDKESREYVLDWLYYMTYLRCGTHLVLNGAKGVGKNLFTKLCSSLVGKRNSYSARASVLGQFNKPLEDKRLVLFDEIKVTEANHDRLKELANDTLSIEAKGKDQKEDTRIYFSIIISNNDPTDVFLEYDDRRFSVPILGRKNLKDVMSLEEIVELNDIFEDESSEEVAQFGNWLAKRVPKYDDQTPLKTERFYELVDTSLSAWQSYLLEKIKDAVEKGDESLPLIRVRDTAKEDGIITFPGHNEKIKSFLNTYRYKGEHSLGKFEKDFKSRRWAINITISKKQLNLEENQDIKDLL